MQGAEWGWSAPATVALMAGGVLALVVLAVIERRVRDPLIEIDLFRNPIFTASNLVIFSGQFSKVAIIVFGAVYLQDVLNMNPLKAGIALLVAVVPTAIASLAAGHLADRFGTRRPTLSGELLNVAAMLWIGVTVHVESYLLLVPGLVAWGISLPFHYVPPRRAVMNIIPAAKHGQAGGINMTAQLLGGTIGMAICGALLAATGNFGVIFFAAGGLGAIVLTIAWLSK